MIISLVFGITSLLQGAGELSQACDVYLPTTNASVVLYNRIPKCGSTTMKALIRRLSSEKLDAFGMEAPRYQILYHTWYGMKKPFEVGTEWTDGWNVLKDVLVNHTHRTVYINHMFWPDIATTLPTVRPPHYIQMVRNPAERLPSDYYYKYYGARAMMESRKSLLAEMQNVSFKGAVPDINEWAQYQLVRADRFRLTNESCDRQGNLMTKYFCGHTNPVCKNVCSQEALDFAKRVLSEKYVMVGALEHLIPSLQLLERLLPSWFTGITEAYHLSSHHDKVRNSGNHSQSLAPPNNATLKLFRHWHVQDFHIYDYAVVTLRQKVDACLAPSSGNE